ncbi:MAG: hypothetical protein PQJ46_02300, partial [Spirochaetales bacterium]|nr:hypothetical protein [Spirochaetales bacterium]
MKKIFWLLICMLILFSGCQTTQSKAYDFDDSDDPVEYEEDEFPEWLKTIRRTEIVFAGSIPITLMVSSLAFTLYDNISGNE